MSDPLSYCKQNNKLCVWCKVVENVGYTCYFPPFLQFLWEVRLFGGSTFQCGTYTTLESIDGDWVDWLLEKRSEAKQKRKEKTNGKH